MRLLFETQEAALFFEQATTLISIRNMFMTQKQTSFRNLAFSRKRQQEKKYPTKSFLQRVADFLKSLGEWRDHLLVIVGLFYAAGYFIWSWNAFQNNLGLLPAFQFQYIVAGIGPVIIGVISFGGGLWFWRWLTNVWLVKIETGPTHFWRILRSVFDIIVIVSIGFVSVVSNPTAALLILTFVVIFRVVSFLMKHGFKLNVGFSKLDKESFLRKLWEFFLLAIALNLAFQIIYWFWKQQKLINPIILNEIQKVAPTKNITNWSSWLLLIAIVFGVSSLIPKWLAKFYRVFYFLLFVVGFTILSLSYYQERIYAELPQELGGMKPRCAFLDLQVENLSNEMRSAILPALNVHTENPITRSDKLDVLFVSNNIIMVRPNQQTHGDKNIVYEIPRTNVQAITWCK